MLSPSHVFRRALRRFHRRCKCWDDSGRRRLALRARNARGLRIASDFGREKLEGYEAVQFGVFGLVDDAHAAAEFFEDAIVGNVVDGSTSPWERL